MHRARESLHCIDTGRGKTKRTHPKTLHHTHSFDGRFTVPVEDEHRHHVKEGRQGLPRRGTSQIG